MLERCAKQFPSFGTLLKPFETMAGLEYGKYSYYVLMLIIMEEVTLEKPGGWVGKFTF